MKLLFALNFIIAIFISCNNNKAQQTISSLQDKKIPRDFLDSLVSIKKSDRSKAQQFILVEPFDKYFNRYIISFNIPDSGTVQGRILLQKIKRDNVVQMDTSLVIKENIYNIDLSKIVMKCKTHNGKHECGLFDDSCQDAFEKQFKCSQWYPSN